MELADLKKRYTDLAQKHKLPSFKDVNEDFEMKR